MNQLNHAHDCRQAGCGSFNWGPKITITPKRVPCYCGQPSSTNDSVGHGLCASCAVKAALSTVGR